MTLTNAAIVSFADLVQSPKTSFQKNLRLLTEAKKRVWQNNSIPSHRSHCKPPTPGLLERQNLDNYSRWQIKHQHKSPTYQWHCFVTGSQVWLYEPNLLQLQTLGQPSLFGPWAEVFPSGQQLRRELLISYIRIYDANNTRVLNESCLLPVCRFATASNYCYFSAAFREMCASMAITGWRAFEILSAVILLAS